MADTEFSFTEMFWVFIHPIIQELKIWNKHSCIQFSFITDGNNEMKLVNSQFFGFDSHCIDRITVVFVHDGRSSSVILTT